MPLRNLILLIASALFAAPLGAAPRVVVTIKPLHALVWEVMQGVGEPRRLLPDGASAHSYALRPSELRALHRADIVFWLGDELETFMVKPLTGLDPKTEVVRLIQSRGLTILPVRRAGAWGAQDHAHAEHGTGEDPHVWLDPHNAMALGSAIAEALARLDPVNAPRYAQNAKMLHARLAALDASLATQLKGLGNKPYVVFHDAYHYFEARYDLHPVGALALDPAHKPGARRVSTLRARIGETGAGCVFGEPRFRPALIETLIEDTKARYAVLDPMGTDIEEGGQAYFQMMQNLADTLSGCLKQGAANADEAHR